MLAALTLSTLSALTARELCVISNTQDPVSVQVAAYYLEKRQIPAANLINVSFPLPTGYSRPPRARESESARRPRFSGAYIRERGPRAGRE